MPKCRPRLLRLSSVRKINSGVRNTPPPMPVKPASKPRPPPTSTASGQGPPGVWALPPIRACPQTEKRAGREQCDAKHQRVAAPFQMQPTAQPRARNGGNGERPEDFPVEKSCALKPPEGDGRHDAIHPQCPRPRHGGRESQQRRHRQIAGRPAMSDRGIQKRHHRDGDEQEGRLCDGQVWHGVRVAIQARPTLTCVNGRLVRARYFLSCPTV